MPNSEQNPEECDARPNGFHLGGQQTMLREPKLVTKKTFNPKD
jgi:hypothetical protein